LRQPLFYFLYLTIVYILFSCSLNKYYIGCTDGSVEERLRKHLTNHKGFTAKAKDWLVVHTERYSDKKNALSRVRQLKSWKRCIKVEELIQGDSHG